MDLKRLSRRLCLFALVACLGLPLLPLPVALATEPGEPTVTVTFPTEGIYVGEPVTVSWEGSGGVPPYSFEVTWQVLDTAQNRTDIPAQIVGQTATYLPTAAGWIWPRVTITDSRGWSRSPGGEYSRILYRTEPITVTVTVDKTETEVGSPITATWQVTGGAGSLQSLECVWLQEAGGAGEWAEFPTAYTGNSSTFTPTQGGWCLLRVHTRDLNYTSAYHRSGSVLVKATMTDPKPRFTDKMLRDKVAEVAAQCKAAASGEYARAKWLYTYLTSNATYDYTFTYYDAHGVLLAGTGVCDSFSKAYELLLNAVGITNKRVSGKGNGGAHSWNLVKIAGAWYHADATWDDRGGYGYFLKSDDVFGSNHTWSRTRYPAAPYSYGEGPTQVAKGDANASGTVEPGDALALITYLIDIRLPEAPDAADVNSNGKIEMDDLTAIIDMIVK